LGNVRDGEMRKGEVQFVGRGADGGWAKEQ